MNTVEKLSALRGWMHLHALDFYYVPSSDAHQNEYVPSCWQRRVWLTNFTGSAGDALVSADKAYLWTDGRYVLQANKELDAQCFTLMLQQQGMAAPIDQWLASHRKPLRVGVDPRVLTISQYKRMQTALAEQGGEMVSIAENAVDLLWKDRPDLSHKPVMVYPVEYAGESVDAKLKRLRQAMTDKKIQAHALNNLDAIAWLYNIRGQDVEFNPLVISYALITQTQAYLCVETHKVSEPDQKALKSLGITVVDYDQFEPLMRQQTGLVWLDPGLASQWMANVIPVAQQFHAASPITLWKASKNPTEIKGTQIAHQRDGVAVVNFIHWLENHWKSGVDELSAADQLEQCRAQGKHYKGASFDTIAGFADNGAVIHYRASDKTNKKIDDTNLFLLDSGGQYLEGTTDITRVFHLGTPTAKQKRDYTLVLKGHLALRHAVFPEGTCGVHIEALARQFLWQKGLDFKHGTGHGVGAYLCVHEGPQRISPGMIPVPLQAGMIVSNEPGVYFPGQYGIRIENLCLIQQAIPADQCETQHGPFYTLRDLTVVPYARNLIEVSLLTVEEIQWVNEYHANVFEALHKDLSTEVQEWLKKATAPLRVKDFS